MAYFNVKNALQVFHVYLHNKDTCKGYITLETGNIMWQNNNKTLVMDGVEQVCFKEHACYLQKQANTGMDRRAYRQTHGQTGD